MFAYPNTNSYFFALYKVLFVTLETRHAPFYGWIKDLSAPDPTTIFNLFGLLNFSPPSFLLIGVWPILMALTMFLQTKLNPYPSRSSTSKDYDLPSCSFFIFIRNISSWISNILDLEQCFIHWTAMDYNEKNSLTKI